MAREFKAFVRAKKVKTPVQLLRVVFLYCGLDKPLREVAGTFTSLYESITDQSVAERLRACGPWVKAMLRRMLPSRVVAEDEEVRRVPLRGVASRDRPILCGTAGEWRPANLYHFAVVDEHLCSIKAPPAEALTSSKSTR
jgi:hypothetical protein